MADTDISVIGSYLVGMTMRVPRFPASGETIAGHSAVKLHGGKGSNQAVGCARLGGRVRFLTALGDDAFGREALELYKAEGVEHGRILISGDEYTGIGFVIVDDTGENIITIDPGANRLITPAFVDEKWEYIRDCGIIMMQMEVDTATVAHVLKRAKEEGIYALLNPAPYSTLPQECWQHVYLATPNEGEMRQILNLPLNAEAEHHLLARRLHSLGCENIVLTLGSKGAFVSCSNGVQEYIRADEVKAIDTTGAGDCFSAALAVSIMNGSSIKEGAEYAVRAAGICVTRYGVIEALPYLHEIK